MSDSAIGDNVTVDLAKLRSRLSEAFVAVGVREVEATRIVDALLESELCEVRSHGIIRVPKYLDRLQSGAFNAHATISVSPTGPAATLIDGDGGLGYLPTWIAVESASEAAGRLGIGLAGVKNVAEFGRAAYYAEEAANRGFVAIVCQNTPPILGSPGSTRATHGNNPLAFTAPFGCAPLFDAAFTPRAAGELVRRSTLGLGIPSEWGYVDSGGEAITDPAVALASVAPAVGAAKGFGMVLLVDLLAGVLTGASSGPEARRGGATVGAFVLALSPDVLGAGDEVEAKLMLSAEAVRQSGGRWPGDRAREARRRNLDDGTVKVPKSIYGEVQVAIEEVLRGGRP